MKDLTAFLRPARLSDTADLHRNCFPAEPSEAVQSYLRWCLGTGQRSRIVRMVAEVNGEVIANGELSIHRGRGEIGSLIVAPAYRRCGIGRALADALIEEARSRHLCCLEITARCDAPWVQAWYERLGFSLVGEHTFPGNERVAVLRMRLPADPSAGDRDANPRDDGCRALGSQQREDRRSAPSVHASQEVAPTGRRPRPRSGLAASRGAI